MGEVLVQKYRSMTYPKGIDNLVEVGGWGLE